MEKNDGKTVDGRARARLSRSAAIQSGQRWLTYRCGFSHLRQFRSRGPPSTFLGESFERRRDRPFLRSAACVRSFSVAPMKKVRSTVSHTHRAAQSISCIHTFHMEERDMFLSSWDNERNATSSTHGKRSFRCEIKKKFNNSHNETTTTLKTRERENLDRGVMRQPHENNGFLLYRQQENLCLGVMALPRVEVKRS